MSRVCACCVWGKEMGGGCINNGLPKITTKHVWKTVIFLLPWILAV